MMVPPHGHEEALLRLSLQHFETTGEYREPSHFQQALAAGPPPDAVRPGCLVGLLGRLLQSMAGVGAPASASSGQRTNKATEKLDAASAAIEARAASLSEKASTMRATAKALHAQGDKRSALLMLKRSKAMEKQAESAQQTQLSLEQQRDLLESAAVQKSVSEALAQAVKKSKRSTRGLLSKAETAVEESAELHDMSSDIQAVMGELGQQGTDAFDDDELAAELAEMMAEDAPSAVPSAKPKAVASASPDSVAVPAGTLGQFPRAPTNVVHAVKGEAVAESGV